MNGIAISLLVDGDRETVYLATRRTDPEQDGLMREAYRTFRRARAKAASSLIKVAALSTLVEGKRKLTTDKLLDVLDKQEAAILAAEELEEESTVAAITFLRSSLEENYGADQAAVYMGRIPDAQLPDLVKIIEYGQAPADFFAGCGTPPSAKSTSPGDGSPPPSCSGTDSAPPTSRPDASASKTPRSSTEQSRPGSGKKTRRRV